MVRRVQQDRRGLCTREPQTPGAGLLKLETMVVFGGASYASLQASNHGQTTGLGPTWWGVLASLSGPKPGPVGVTGPTGTSGATGVQGFDGSNWCARTARK